MNGVVKQLASGVVISCTACYKCMQQNPDQANKTDISKLQGTTYGTWRKNCLLSVLDHGERCLAYPNDTEVWLIDEDINKVKQIN